MLYFLNQFDSLTNLSQLFYHNLEDTQHQNKKTVLATVFLAIKINDLDKR
ncbi:hypothetical protein J500_2048 [Acinetobacter sp. 479375]|nr:hypothetical protein J500_2048 [Acinetobacter sp. 479375]